MKTDETHGEIMLMLGEIRGDVKAINQRFDKLNGSVADTMKNVQILQNVDSDIHRRVLDLEDERDKRDRNVSEKKKIWYTKFVDVLVTTGVTTITSVGLLKTFFTVQK